MSYILGMDLGVFLAWIGTLLVTILCLIYGLYHKYIKKSEEIQQLSSEEARKKQEDDQ